LKLFPLLKDMLHRFAWWAICPVDQQQQLAIGRALCFGAQRVDLERTQ